MVYFIKISLSSLYPILDYQKYGIQSPNGNHSFLKTPDCFRVVFKQCLLHNLKKHVDLPLVSTHQLSSPLPFYLLVVWSPGNKTHSCWVPVISLCNSQIALYPYYWKIYMYDCTRTYLPDFFPQSPMCFLNNFLFPCK